MDALKKIVAIYLLSTFSIVWANPLTQNEFTDYFVAHSKGSLTGLELSPVRPLQLAAKGGNGLEMSVFLDDSYALYRSSPDSLEQIIESRAASIQSSHDLLGRLPGRSVLAVIKPASYLATVQKQGKLARAGNHDLAPVHRKLNDDLLVFYVFDGTKGARMVTERDLSEMKADEDSLHQLALGNLSKYFEKKALQVRRLEKIANARVYTIVLDQFLEASALLLPNYWTGQFFDVQGNIVAFVPARNTVVVTGSEDSEGVRIASYLAEASFKEFGNAISPKGFRYEDGTWTADLR